MFKRNNKSSGMSLRLFRNPAKKSLFLARRPTIPTLIDMGDLEPLCEGLSQENIENVSMFRADVNIFRAEKGEDAIELAVAMKYLKAARFNATKAMDIYKNYQKHQETYQLDSLKVHREPLCSEIGSRKLEIVGTYDREGSSLILFTGSKHNVKHSDSKASMQLLFYILDQAAESEHSQEAGVVLLLDLRETSINCSSYLNNILSVIREGYPLYIKSVYFIDIHAQIKRSPSVVRFLKQEGLKAKVINYSDLSSHFEPSLLPLSLGGTYTPGKEPTYPFCALKTTRPMAQRNRIHRPEGKGDFLAKLYKRPEATGVDSESQRTVNSLARVFEPSANDGEPHKTSSSHLHTGGDHKLTPSHTKPLPPTPQKSKLQSSFTQSLSQSAPKKPPHFNKPHSNGHSPTPPNKFSKSQSTDVPSSSEESNKWALLKPKGSPRPGAMRKQPLCATASDSDILSTAQGDRSPTGVASRIRNWNQQVSQTKSTDALKPPVSSASVFLRRDSDDILTASSSPSSKHRPRGRAGSDVQKKSKPLVPVQVLSGDEPDTHSHPTTEGKQPMLPPGKPKPKEYENFDMGPRRKAKSFDKDLKSEKSEYENVSVGPVHVHQASQRNGEDSIPVHIMSSSISSPQHVPQSYENVTLHSPPTSLVHSPNDHNPPPSSAPPEPPEYAVVGPKSPVAPQNGGSQYELVNFTSKPKLVGDDGYSSDDDTLFGKEGPPGLHVAIYQNFGPDEGNTLMTVDELGKHISSKGKNGLAEEYLKIKNEPLVGPYTSCRLKCNLSKNRYKDVICYEGSRVKLKPVKGVEGSDYIHGNHVSGYNNPEQFILTQGPKDKTVCDFWRMIWEKQVHVIVMVTKCIEMMKRKCAQYWPETAGNVMKHKNISVEMTQIQTLDGFEKRTLKVTCKGVERMVTHFQFLAWPDYGVPSNGGSVLDLLFAVREAQASTVAKHKKDFKHSHEPPIVVHCSAGVGRSGAFCALDNAIDELEDKRKVNLQGIVRKMRLQRAYAIQTEEQYEFCYTTLLEYAKTHR